MLAGCHGSDQLYTCCLVISAMQERINWLQPIGADGGSGRVEQTLRI